ncbi:ComEA family DNA-binding protein [Nocardioides daeguensis]|uniref:Helix-hairpin-helix DNA-binding motif class 1 domain-containing protein n=1 Tax=Nocardioides daeguensis TaxID=908359 RepID=A0ABP6VK28_9ACTN
MSVRRSAARPDSPGADAAARRLALIAADLGVTPATDADPEPWWADHTRVADAPGPERVGPGAPAAVTPLPVEREAPALPVPGRHASRRRRPRPDPRDALAPLAGRLPALGLPQVAVVALAVALGLAVTTWWVLRDRTEPLAPVSAGAAAPLVATAPSASLSIAPSVSPSTSRQPTPGSADPSSGSATVTVDVAGKVRRPGIVVLSAGARVRDALAAAGGARRGVDLTPLNLARVLVDGEQIVVGARSPGGAVAPTGGSGAGASGPAGPLVNLNTAGQAELEGLPEVGPVTAQSIIAWREAHGGFTSIDELLEVDGIGPRTLEQITPHVTV